MDYPTLVLTGKNLTELKNELSSLSKYYCGFSPLFVRVKVEGPRYEKEKFMSFDEIESSILNSSDYIIDNFIIPKRLTLKSDGNSKIHIVHDYDFIDDEGYKVKKRKPTNITPKKKKRKKR